MGRLNLILVAVVGILAGALVVTLIPRQSPPVDEAAIRAVVEQVIAERPMSSPAQDVASIDPHTLNPMIETYLMDNPAILDRMSVALREQTRRETTARNRDAIATVADALFEEPGQIVIGNPEGDVTLVEFFDYNCGYCRGALPDLATLIQDDPNLRVVLKEFPILSDGSVQAARVGVRVNALKPEQYWAFHQSLFTTRGQADEMAALAAANNIGLSPMDLSLEMSDDQVGQVIEKSYSLAQTLNITGTPTFIIGDEIIPGAIPIDQLRTRIDNMRACGKTNCAEG